MNQSELNTRFEALSADQKKSCSHLIAKIFGAHLGQAANDLTQEYQTDLDDSSDEEEIRLSNSVSYDAVAEWNKFKVRMHLPPEKISQYQISFLAHAIGVSAFYSAEVEGIYRGAQGLKSRFLKSETNVVEDLLYVVEGAFCASLKTASLDRSKVLQVENLIKLIAVENSDLIIPCDLVSILKDEERLAQFFNKIHDCLKLATTQAELFDRDFTKNFAFQDVEEMMEIFLQEAPKKPEHRKILQGDASFSVTKEDDLLAALRLMQRSGKRQEVTLDEDYDPIDSQSFLMRYEAIGQGSYQERNVANWGGEKTSKVYPYGEYDAVSEIVKHFSSNAISGEKVAELVLNIFDKVEEINALADHQKEYIAALHHLFFGDEVEKNPACYVTNKAAFRMLIGGAMTWDEFLSPNAVAVIGRDDLTTPAVLSGEDSVAVARKLNSIYRDCMPVKANHSMPRPTSAEPDIEAVEQMIERESRLIKKWLNLRQSSCDEMDASQLLKLMKDSLLAPIIFQKGGDEEVPAKKMRLTSVTKAFQGKVNQGGLDV